MYYVKGRSHNSALIWPHRPSMISTKRLEYCMEELEFMGLEFLSPHIPWDSHQNPSIKELSISRAVRFPHKKS